MACKHNQFQTMCVIQRAWDDDTKEMIGAFAELTCQCLECGCMVEWLGNDSPQALAPCSVQEGGLKLITPIAFSEVTREAPSRISGLRGPQNN